MELRHLNLHSWSILYHKKFLARVSKQSMVKAWNPSSHQTQKVIQNGLKMKCKNQNCKI